MTARSYTCAKRGHAAMEIGKKDCLAVGVCTIGDDGLESCQVDGEERDAKAMAAAVPCCPRCKSERVLRDATVHWVRLHQRWDIAEMDAGMECLTCGFLFEHEEAVLRTLPPAS